MIEPDLSLNRIWKPSVVEKDLRGRGKELLEAKAVVKLAVLEGEWKCPKTDRQHEGPS